MSDFCIHHGTYHCTHHQKVTDAGDCDDVALRMAVAAMSAWEEQLIADDGTFGLAEVRQAIRATLDAVAAVRK